MAGVADWSNQMSKLVPHKLSEVRSAVLEALSLASAAVGKALAAGQMLAEVKAGLPHGQWLPWLARHLPELSEDTAERWIKAVTNAAVGAGIQTATLSLPFSQVLALAPADLPLEEREAQQLFLDFTANKTLKECMAGVIVEGDEPHRITRAANGKRLGGSNGEDRKDWPEFIGRKLEHITSHLGHQMTPGQAHAIGAKFDAALRQWPRWLNELLADYARRENKLSDAQRAGREGKK
jgi:hypothetical protein